MAARALAGAALACALTGCAIVAQAPPGRDDLQPFPPGVDAACAGEQPARETLRKFVKPSYPVDAVIRGVQGWVCVGFGLDLAGVPIDPEVLASAPPGVFDEAALAALREWRFEPTLDADGRPAPLRGLRLPLLFALDAKTWAEATRSGNGR